MKKLLLYIFTVTIFLSGAGISHADVLDTASSVTGKFNGDRSTYTLLEPLPCVPTRANPCTPGTEIKTFTVNQFIEYVFKFIIALAVLLATIQIIIGGFQYMGSDSYSSKNDAKKRFKDAAAGLIGALVSFLVLQTIDPRLVQINAEIAPVCTAEALQPGGICNPAETIKFINAVEKHLQDLSVKNRDEVRERQKKIDDLKNQRDVLVDRYKYGDDESGENRISDEEYQLELARLDEQIRTESSLNMQQIMTGSQQQYYKQGLLALHSENAVTNESGWDNIVGLKGELNESSKQAIKNAQESIEKQYKELINDPNLNAEDKKKLENRKQFFINQLNGEQEYSKTINRYIVSTDTGGEGYTTGDLTKTLESEKRAYQAQIDFLTEGKKTSESKDYLALAQKDPTLPTTLSKAKADPLIQDEYLLLLRTRMQNTDLIMQKKQQQKK